jgi:hypothetical protein
MESNSTAIEGRTSAPCSASSGIADAPRDGTHIIAHDGSMFPPEVIHWHVDAWYRSGWPTDDGNEYNPVEWWPLPSVGRWYNIHEKQPEEGQIVSLWFSHRQIRQAVRAPEYSGGFKMPNCAGWECVGHHWGWMWSPQYIPEPTPEERKWRDPIPWQNADVLARGESATPTNPKPQ